MPKYYIGKFTQYHGEYETPVICRFKINFEDNPDEYLEIMAKEWYCDGDGNPDVGYEFNCGDIATRAYGYKEVAEEVFNTLDLIYMEDFTC